MKFYAHSLSTWKNVALIGIFTFLLVACGDDSKAAGGTEEDSAITAIKDKTVSGVSQKGPFVKGASVTVYELDGKSLSQTGRSYEGKIKNERGEFSVDVVKLESQYALLKADGYYRNEITGEKSNSTVTLYAMTNLSDRNEVNVNLLTHLEYERSRYLVKYEKMGVGKAKLQAESEVLKSFGIEDELENSENLNIFGEDDGSAALLAISVLMQGDLKEADFTERLTEYADDIEEDGVWDDKKTATKIADWASEKRLNGGLTTIRDNIAGWELSADVPAFEKYVNNYWWQNYGLGSCTEKREGEVLQNTNALSKSYETYFICKKGVWRVATDIEKDTYKWLESSKDVADGEVRAGQVNRDIYYIYVAGKNVWRVATDVEKDTYKQECSRDGKMFYGNVNKTTKYVCDNGMFRTVEEFELEIDSTCTSYNLDVYYIPPKVNGENNYSYCKCTEDGWAFTTEKLNRGTMIDERNGREYKTIGIKSQMWMAENLNYADNVNYPCMSSVCKNDADSCELFGRYYEWRETVGCVEYDWSSSKNFYDQVQGICPEGWHVPTIEEWRTLYVAMGSNPYAMQAKNFAVWAKATDEYGFSALPAGCYDGEFRDANGAYFWSFTAEKNVYFHWDLFANSSGENEAYYVNKDCPGISVRCLLGAASRQTAKSSASMNSSSSSIAKSSSSVKETSSSSEKMESSSSSKVNLASPCKTELEDNCEYGELIDNRDGQTYKTVIIGSQTWMAENLNYKTANSYCFGSDTTNCTEYGRFYTWATAVDKSEKECGERYVCSLPSGNIQGVCPSGWHLPSTDEWNVLFIAVGDSLTTGSKLKSTSGWPDSRNGSDDFGFSAFPIGFGASGTHEFEGICTSFWSSSEHDYSYYAYHMSLSNSDDSVHLNYSSKSAGFSVRCLKD